MSWIKKMLSFLQDQEEGKVEYKSSPSKNEKLIYKKELDAKMVYQYPKGEFGFPLISDESIESTDPHDQHLKRRENHAKRPIRNEMDDYETPEKLKSDAFKKPFIPTEVPSPVYGFRNRPKVKEQEIEYELPDSKKRASRSTNVVESPQKPLTDEQKVVESSNDDINKDQYPKFTEENTVVQKNIPSESPSILEEELIVRPEVQQPYTIHTDLPDEAVSSPEPTQNKVAGKIDPQNFKSIMKPSEETLPSNEEQNMHEKKCTDQHEALREPEPPSVKQEDQQPKSKVKTLKQQPQPVKEKKPGQLPFNVMMLKQDRRKLKSKEATPSTPSTLNTEKAEPSVQSTPKKDVQPEVGNKEAESVSIPTATLQSKEEDPAYYAFPSMDLLTSPIHTEVDHAWLNEQAELLDETLFHFNVNAKVRHVTQGPSVTRFEIFPEKGVKVSKVTGLTDDIKLSLAARDIRMEAPIPGKTAIGIEIPNPTSRPVALKEILDHQAFKESTATLPIALGLDIEGQPVVTDIGKMPHGLIAGATGSGKSVCINSILVSLLYHSSPDDLRLLLIDPKMVELAPYNHIPHLVSPVITDVKAATAALKWSVEEMERRYQLFAHAGVRDIGRYNQKAKEARQFGQKLPYLVIIIDELADLMMMSPADVEESICRIAQKARACGIHLLIATQRPSVDVITGLIKANVPTRVAFSVSSQVDSRTIIDQPGADRLLGRGDMLFLGNGASKPVRLQGTFVSDDEIDAVVAHARKEREVNYLFHQEELLAKVEIQDEGDELLMDACELVVTQGGASTSLLQRHFRIGYNRAARLIDLMQKQGWISEAKGSKPRDVLMTAEDLRSLQETGTSS